MKSTLVSAFIFLCAPVMAQYKITQKTEPLGDKNNVRIEKKTFKLHGNPIKVGQTFPVMRLKTSDGLNYQLGKPQEKKTLIVVLYSVSTDLCQKNLLNYYNKTKHEDINVIFVSADPYVVQQAFLKKHNLKNITLLSDAKSHHFGLSTGLLIKESYLLTRALIVIDENAVIRHIQRVPDLTTLPDLDVALSKLID